MLKVTKMAKDGPSWAQVLPPSLPDSQSREVAAISAPTLEVSSRAGFRGVVESGEDFKIVM